MACLAASAPALWSSRFFNGAFNVGPQAWAKPQEHSAQWWLRRMASWGPLVAWGCREIMIEYERLTLQETMGYIWLDDFFDHEIDFDGWTSLMTFDPDNRPFWIILITFLWGWSFYRPPKYLFDRIMITSNLLWENSRPSFILTGYSCKSWVEIAPSGWSFEGLGNNK